MVEFAPMLLQIVRSDCVDPSVRQAGKQHMPSSLGSDEYVNIAGVGGAGVMGSFRLFGSAKFVLNSS